MQAILSRALYNLPLIHSFTHECARLHTHTHTQQWQRATSSPDLSVLYIRYIWPPELHLQDSRPLPLQSGPVRRWDVQSMGRVQDVALARVQEDLGIKPPTLQLEGDLIQYIYTISIYIYIYTIYFLYLYTLNQWSK